MQLVTEVRVTVQLRDVGVHVVQANLGVGHDRVEVVHQIALRHMTLTLRLVGLHPKDPTISHDAPADVLASAKPEL
jgi:hypothetical protein